MRTYANALVQGQRGNNHHKKINKRLEEINLQVLLVEMQAQTIYQMKSPTPIEQKIKFLNPNKGKQTRGKSPTKSHSKTDYTQNVQAKQPAKDIEELKKEIAQ